MSYQFNLLFINNQHTISDLQSFSVLIYYSFSVRGSVLVISSNLVAFEEHLLPTSILPAF